MAARKRAATAAEAVLAARENPYIQRLVEDADLRENVRTAYESLRVAYGRMSNGKPATRALMEDKKLQKNLRTAAVSLREVGESLREGPKRSRRGGIGRKLLVVVVGAGLALALSEGLRKKVLDGLFGKEEEFDYTSTTTPNSAPSPVADTATA
ncbi:MAG TPA: hypothetical protein VHE14_06850 [Solirubrobacteraceae bacterium]|nr:hypothetical protein [Solirubrobacteraceae bacterium]